METAIAYWGYTGKDGNKMETITIDRGHIGNSGKMETPIVWVLPPLSNTWIIVIIWLYIALNRTPHIDCPGRGGVPNL